MAEAKKDAARSSANAETGEATAGTAPTSSGGLKGWLPLIVTILAMPALAFATTQYIILPKIHSALGAPANTGAPGGEDPGAHGGGGDASHAPASGGHGGKGKATASLNKMIVNVAGTLGTRYLVASVTLVGSGADFKNRIDDHRDQLLDVATGTLSNKTIADLEKPGARNEVRAELMSVFNNVLGANAVREIYITELAIQ
jgi:flagellar FliL protein